MENQIRLRILSYKNDSLVELFLQKNSKLVSRQEAYDLFEDLKKFLFVCYLVDRGLAPIKEFVLTEEMDLIDQMWHQFILMTKNYAQFCESIFGNFIHHAPASLNASEENQNFDVSRQIHFVDEVWGQGTAYRWFIAWPSKQKQSQGILNWIRCSFA